MTAVAGGSYAGGTGGTFQLGAGGGVGALGLFTTEGRGGLGLAP